MPHSTTTKYYAIVNGECKFIKERRWCVFNCNNWTQIFWKEWNIVFPSTLKINCIIVGNIT